MPAIRPTITDFAYGELSPRLSGRSDLPIYYRGVQEMTNAVARILGGFSKRAGFTWVGETRSSASARLIPFVIDSSTAMMLEVSAGHVRLWCNDVLATTDGTTPVDIAVTFADISLIKYTQARNTLILTCPGNPPWTIKIKTVTGTTTKTITFDYGNPTFIGNLLSWTASSGTWYASDLWAKCAQWMTMGKDYAATGTFNSKTLTGANRSESTLTLTFSDLSTLALSQTGNYAYQGTININFVPFGSSVDYPASCAFHQGRLLLGGTPSEPNAVFGSKILDYFNFTFFEEVEYSQAVQILYVANYTITGTIASASNSITAVSAPDIAKVSLGHHFTAAGIPTTAIVTDIGVTTVTMSEKATASTSGLSIAMKAWADPTIPEYTHELVKTQQIGPASAEKFLLATEENENVQWIASAGDLAVGTASSEWGIAGNSNATNAKADLVSRHGAANLQARFVAGGVFYAQKSGKSIRPWTTDGKGAVAITAHADHILPGIVAFDYQSDPESVMWVVGTDGNLYRCGMESEPQGYGYSQIIPSWSRVATKAGDLFKSVCVLPSASGDIVYAIVERNMNGSTKRWLERMELNLGETYDDRYFLDCAVKVTSGSNFNFVSGLTRFEGMTVTYFCGTAEADMAKGTAVVSSAQITVPLCRLCYIGLPYTMKVNSFRLEQQAQTEGLKKQAPRVYFRLYKSGPFTVRYTADTSKYSDTVALPGAVKNYSGPVALSRANMPDTDVSIIMESADPWPVGVQVISPELDVGTMQVGGA